MKIDKDKSLLDPSWVVRTPSGPGDSFETNLKD